VLLGLELGDDDADLGKYGFFGVVGGEENVGGVGGVVGRVGGLGLDRRGRRLLGRFRLCSTVTGSVGLLGLLEFGLLCFLRFGLFGFLRFGPLGLLGFGLLGFLRFGLFGFLRFGSLGLLGFGFLFLLSLLLGKKDVRSGSASRGPPWIVDRRSVGRGRVGVLVELSNGGLLVNRARIVHRDDDERCLQVGRCG
jgi:hypothetical protein